jgi:hypothetical protein
VTVLNIFKEKVVHLVGVIKEVFVRLIRLLVKRTCRNLTALKARVNRIGCFRPDRGFVVPDRSDRF